MIKLPRLFDRIDFDELMTFGADDDLIVTWHIDGNHLRRVVEAKGQVIKDEEGYMISKVVDGVKYFASSYDSRDWTVKKEVSRQVSVDGYVEARVFADSGEAAIDAAIARGSWA